jgi:transcriptional regulator with XRE-family HTH domain
MTPFGCYLESLRRNRRLKQKDIAEMIGVNPSYISAMESGKKGPPSDDLIRSLAESLNLSTSEDILLWDYAAQSVQALRIPDNLPVEEYAVINGLQQAFGTLSKGQITIICAALSMNVDSKEVAQMRMGENR